MENQKTPFTFTEWGITQDCVHPLYRCVKFKDGLHLFKDVEFTREMESCKPGEKYAYALLDIEEGNISFYNDKNLSPCKVIKVTDVQVKKVSNWSEFPLPEEFVLEENT